MSQKNNQKSLLYLIVLGIIVFATLFYLYKSILIKKQRNEIYNKALVSFLSKNNPQGFEDIFVKDILSHTNDEFTKSSAYFIMYQYISNGGNIYAVYDFINNHPELAFLKEAEVGYPQYFSFVQKRKLPFTYSDQGMYVYLAYLEVLVKYNYGDVSTLSSLASQYAKMAYYKNLIVKDHLKGINLNYPQYSEEEIQYDISKSKISVVQGEGGIKNILISKVIDNNILTRNTILGLVEYASAIRYLDSLRNINESKKFSQDIFSTAVLLAYNTKTDLYFYTSIANAVTLLLAQGTDMELRNALYPFFDYKINEETNQNAIAVKIIKSRLQNNSARFRDLDLYSKVNILALAKRVPEFKKWLIVNGWQERDFLFR